jgi:hypothetical protein
MVHEETQMILLKKMIAWLKKPGNTEAKLAVLLGYRDAAPVKAWVRRKRIPSYRIEQVTQIVTEGEKK